MNYFVSRLPNKYLYYIRNRSHKIINPRVFDLKRKKGCFKMNCYAQFYCSKCSNEWTSNLVTIELWWNKDKTEFDVRVYGQKCKRCVLDFIPPNYIYNINNIIKKCIDVLTNNYYKKKKNFNEKFNKVNSKHDQEKCQKCQIIGHPCWI